MHYFGFFDDRALAPHPRFGGRADGYREAELVNERTGSVHTGLAMCELAAGGTLAPHVHSYEEGFYVLSGDAVVSIGERSVRVGPGDYGALKVGTPHGWRTSGGAPVRWLQMAAPQPKPVGSGRDTFFPKNGSVPTEAAPLDAAGATDLLLGHFDVNQIPRGDEGRITTGGLQGVFLKWLIDEKLGARHQRMLFIEYQPGVSIGLHDHTFEESYFILSGEVQATLDGREYLARAGNVLWTGVGCVHAFANVGREPVRWLETFSPQPPAENVFRFVAEWAQRAKELEGT
ncbi:MAG TPA: cupin domain-containing protein [Vicinamibacterales bacterium]|nr:cupin domain-containing protein [Vicinamibacterales bacterium]